MRAVSTEAVNDFLRLLYFMLPAYAANMSAPFSRYWHGPNPPINARLLGSHKTVVGFGMGILAAIVVTALQAWLDLADTVTDYAQWPLLGLGFGIGSMAADAVKSLVKRRLRIAPGAPWIPFDQVDFVIGALACVAPLVQLPYSDVFVILAVTFVGDLAINRLSFRMGIKRTPW